MFKYSVIARLDPGSIFKYVCEEERGKEDHTTFLLRSLSVTQYRQCEELLSDPSHRMGMFGLKVLEYGLIGWDNFTYEGGEVIPFDFNGISSVPYMVQLELIQEIMIISELEDELVNEIAVVTRWANWSDKNKNAYQWDCDYCLEHKIEKKRNCDGTLPNVCSKCKEETSADECDKCGIETKPQFKFYWSKNKRDFITRCPLSLLTPRAIKLVNMINYIDNSKSLPFLGGALDQTNFFFNIRMVVLSEQNALLRKEMDEIPKKGK